MSAANAMREVSRFGSLSFARSFELNDMRESVCAKRFVLEQKDQIASQEDPEAYVLEQILEHWMWSWAKCYMHVFFYARDALVRPFVGEIELGVARGSRPRWHGIADIELRDLVGVTAVFLTMVDKDGTHRGLYASPVDPSATSHRIPLAMAGEPTRWFTVDDKYTAVSLLPRTHRYSVSLNDGGSATLAESHVWFNSAFERTFYRQGGPRYFYVNGKLITESGTIIDEPDKWSGSLKGGGCCTVM